MHDEAGREEAPGAPERVRGGDEVPGTASRALGPGALPANFHEAAFRESPVALALARDPHCAVVLRNPAMNRIVPASLDWRAWRLPDGAAPPLFEGGVALALDRQPLRLAAYRGEATTDREIELRWPGREPVFLRVSAAPLFDAAGAPSGAIAAAVDITAETLADRRRAPLAAAAEAASRARDEFLSLMGHELRNPLNAIATAVEVLNRAAPAAPEAQSARRIIGRQTRRLAELIGEAGEIGRALGAAADLVRQPIDLGGLLVGSIARAAATAAAKGQTFEARLGEARIDADAERLGDAIERLLDAASRAAAEGRKIVVRLRRGVGPGGGEAVVEIGDADALGAVDAAVDASAPGLGAASLGLALTLVRHVVELHRGRLDARRPDGTAAGTVFCVRLPALAAAAPLGAIDGAPPEARGDNPPAPSTGDTS